MTDARGVLVIYTGGTIGSLPEDPRDSLSPLVPKSLEEVMERLPNYDPRDKKIVLRNQWIRLGIHSWETPIDSSNISLNDWKEIAAIIKKYYSDYEGFVVLHGTDTLAYTASALSFMFDNLSKPVVITGSQRPIAETRSDAVQNFVTAIEIAAASSLGESVIPEVCVFFRDSLYRGCRTTKLSASDYNAFDSPNFPPLARAGEHIRVNNPLLQRSSQQTLSINDRLEPNIASLDIFPGMSTELLSNILSTKSLKGVVMQTFGTGNAPTTPDFLEVIREAVAGGKVIVDVTQCRSGEVELGLYDVSAGLLSRGVISGLDLTPEAALTKLGSVLGKENDPAKAADIFQLNLKGEQSKSIFNLHFAGGEVGDDTGEPVVLKQNAPMVEGLRYDSEKLHKALLRIMGLEASDNRTSRIELRAFLDLPDADKSTRTDTPRFLGEGSKVYSPADGAENVFFEINKAAKRFISGTTEHSLTIVSLTGGIRWEKANIALITTE